MLSSAGIRDVVRVENRVKSQSQRRGVRCSGSSVCDPKHRPTWIRQLPSAMQPTAGLLGAKLDSLVALKGEAKAAMLAESQ